MKTEFRGRDKDAIAIIKSLVSNPIYKLEIHIREWNEKIGEDWFVIEVLENAQNDYRIHLCSRIASKKEFKELLNQEVKEKVGDRRSALIISTSSLGLCNFRVISTSQKFELSIL